jgi:hypothetical protein
MNAFGKLDDPSGEFRPRPLSPCPDGALYFKKAGNTPHLGADGPGLPGLT